MIPFLFRSPASVVPIFGDSVAFRDVLQMRTQSTDEKKGRATFNIGLTSSRETLSTPHNTQSAPKKQRDALINVRKEKCIGRGLGPILAPQPQMVTTDEALPARANIRIPIIISQLNGLIHRTVTVSQVGRLRCPQVGSKAFFSTVLVSTGCDTCDHMLFDNSQSDRVCKVYEAAICEDPWRAETGNDNLLLFSFLDFWIFQLFCSSGKGKVEKYSR
jgi:hypothetical protein